MCAVWPWVPKRCSSVVGQLLIDAVMEHAVKMLKLRSFLPFMFVDLEAFS